MTKEKDNIEKSLIYAGLAMVTIGAAIILYKACREKTKDSIGKAMLERFKDPSYLN
jgi:hypothetical protein